MSAKPDAFPVCRHSTTSLSDTRWRRTHTATRLPLPQFARAQGYFGAYAYRVEVGGQVYTGTAQLPEGRTSVVVKLW